jgi:4-carboxymuconolactone decarboxylase
MSTDPKAGPSVARARVPLVAKERATPAQLAVWDRIAQSRGRVAGPFAALLHSPELARRIAETGHYVRFEGPLTQAERELAIITVARVFDAQYEWAAHAVLARKAGVRDEVIAAIRERRAPAGLTPAEAQVFAYANGLLREHRVSDEAFAALQKRFGLQGLVDLTATIGYYAMIACALNAFGIEPALSEGEPSQGSPSPSGGEPLLPV